MTLPHAPVTPLGENYSFWFLPFCPFALMPLPLSPSWFSCSFKFWWLLREDFFVFLFTFWLLCRYRRLFWCYSCLHRWQLWPSSLGVKQRLCPFWLQMLKLYLNIWSLGGGKELVQSAPCRSSWDLRIWIAKPKIACFDIQVSNEPNAALAQIVEKSGGDMGLC